MPSRQVRERALARAAAAREITINITLQPHGVIFRALKSQLALVAYFAAYLVSLNRNNRDLLLDSFHPVFFNIFIQWLTSANIWPLRDNSVNTAAARPISQLDTAAFDPVITFFTLFDLRTEDNPANMPTARKLIHAYFMGERMSAKHFMDTIINLIIRYLRVDSPPLPVHISEIYSRSTTPGLTGLKKLLVDAYIWTHTISNGQVPRLSSYLPAFQAHVSATLDAITTRRYAYDAMNPSNPRNREFVDSRIDFARLQACLCNDGQGRLKCRYHLHGAAEPCWDMLVDSTPITGAVRVLPVGRARNC